MWTILGGIAAIILGILGLLKWWLLFLKALAAMVPILLLIGGIIAIIMGISSVKERADEKRRAKKATKEVSEDNQSSSD